MGYSAANKTETVKFKEGIDETIQFQPGFASGAVAFCLSTYPMNGLVRFYLNAGKGFAEMHTAKGYGPIKAKTNNGELMQEHKTHQTLQMDEMAASILKGKQPVVPVDGEDGLKYLKIIDTIYKAVNTNSKVNLH